MEKSNKKIIINMPKKIILKEGGLNGSTAPEGFKFLGLEGQGLSLKTGATVSSVGSDYITGVTVSGTSLVFTGTGSAFSGSVTLPAGGGAEGAVIEEDTNIFVPDFSFNSTSTGANNVALGQRALCSNTSGCYNVAIGHEALRYNTTGYWNTALGTWALGNNTTGYSNVALGQGSLYFNTTGVYNVALGYSALGFNTTGSNNIAIGDFAGFPSNCNFSNTIVLGRYAQATASNQLKIGSSGTPINSAFIETSSGTVNLLTTCGSNVTIGLGAFCNTTGGVNVALGENAMRDATTVSYSVAIGKNAMRNNNGTEYGIAIGYNSLCSNTSGFRNTAIGTFALANNTTGDFNVALGTALSSNTTGHSNIALGQGALFNNTTGNNNIAIGYGAGFPSNCNFSNTIILGKDAQATESNQLVLGSSGTPLGVTASSASTSHVLNVRLNGADYQILLHKPT